MVATEWFVFIALTLVYHLSSLILRSWTFSWLGLARLCKLFPPHPPFALLCCHLDHPNPDVWERETFAIRRCPCGKSELRCADCRRRRAKISAVFVVFYPSQGPHYNIWDFSVTRRNHRIWLGQQKSPSTGPHWVATTPAQALVFLSKSHGIECIIVHNRVKFSRDQKESSPLV